MATIEELKPEFFGLVASWLANPEINRWLSGEWREKPATASIVAIAVRNRRNRLFLVRSDDTPCGLVALGEIDLADRLAMAWYLMGDLQFRGRGITSDALTQLVSLGFNDLGLCCIYAWVMVGNEGSVRVLEKSGFSKVGRLRNAALSHGRQVDRIYFDRSNWR
jgi:RimJ/RimL family protein N-acetyltransferase